MSVRKIKDKFSPYYTPAVRSVSWGTLTAEVSHARTQSLQLIDSNGVNLAVRARLGFYLSADANGDTLATAATGGLANGTNGHVQSVVAGQAGNFVTNASGQADITITTTVTGTYYLVAVLPDGTLSVSPAIVIT